MEVTEALGGGTVGGDSSGTLRTPLSCPFTCDCHQPPLSCTVFLLCPGCVGGGAHTGVTSAGGTVDKKPPGCCPQNVTRIAVTLSCCYSPKSLFLCQRECGEISGGVDRAGIGRHEDTGGRGDAGGLGHTQWYGDAETWPGTGGSGNTGSWRCWGWYGGHGCWRTRGQQRVGDVGNGTGTWRWAGRRGGTRLGGGCVVPGLELVGGLHSPPGDMGDCMVSSGGGRGVAVVMVRVVCCPYELGEGWCVPVWGGDRRGRAVDCTQPTPTVTLGAASSPQSPAVTVPI